MILEQIQALDPGAVIVIDTETTGIGISNNEILSLSMVDLEGNVLFDELVRPERRVRWNKAKEINGISPAMVRDKPTLEEHADEIERIWNDAKLIVGYNLPFDLDFLYDTSLDLNQGIETFDVMREFAPVWGRRSRNGGYRWAKLAQCAKHYGIENGAAHSSIGDAEATRLCYLALLNDDAYRGVRAERDRPAKEAPERLAKAKGREEFWPGVLRSPLRLLALLVGVALLLAALLFASVAVSLLVDSDLGASLFAAVSAAAIAYGAWRLLRLFRGR